MSINGENSPVSGKKLEPLGGMEGSCCCSCPVHGDAYTASTPSGGWNKVYFVKSAIFAVLWAFAYALIEPLSNWLVFNALGFATNSHVGESLEFFIYDTVKILLLLVALIYVIAWLRASLDVERVRDYLAGKKRGLGYFLGAM